MALKFDDGENALRIPRAAAQAVTDADSDDLRVLLLLARAESDGDEFDPAAAAEELGMAEPDVRSSLKFWRGAGVLGRAPRKKTAEVESKRETADAPTKKSTHRDKEAARAALPEQRTAKYTSEELCHIANADQNFRVLLDMAQQTAGHIFNTPEIEIVAGLYAHLGLSPEYILTLLNYYVKHKQKTLRYAEKAAYSLVDQGIDTPAALEEKLKKLEKAASMEGKVRTMFGLGARSLTATEAACLENWFCTWNFDESMIALAYEKTVNNTGKASIRYANSILKAWHDEGFTTPEAVASGKKTKAGGVGKKAINLVYQSFNDEEFFEKAVKRSYAENGGEKP